MPYRAAPWILGGLTLPVLWVVACSGSAAPPPPQGDEGGAAALEQPAQPDEITAGARDLSEDEAPPPLLTPQFHGAAQMAQRSLLAPTEPVEEGAAFDQAAATARGHVIAARSSVRSEDDRHAALVLTVLLAKQRELSLLQMLRRRNTTIAADPELEGVVAGCHAELRAWLEGSAADRERLGRGGCLTLARESIAALTP
jgi:hypothetical protein